jgi:hypothetical protein
VHQCDHSMLICSLACHIDRTCRSRVSRSEKPSFSYKGCRQRSRSCKVLQSKCWAPQHEAQFCHLPVESSKLVTPVPVDMVSVDATVLGEGGADAPPGASAEGKRIPRHIAIIMDGNRRWARRQGLLSCLKGHEAGLDTLKEVARTCQDRGVKALTAFAFSAENWNRSKAEVDGLMALLEGLQPQIDDLCDAGVHFTFFGQLERLPASVQRMIQRCAIIAAVHEGEPVCGPVPGVILGIHAVIMHSAWQHRKQVPTGACIYLTTMQRSRRLLDLWPSDERSLPGQHRLSRCCCACHAA